MAGRRPRRVGELIRQELSGLLAGRVKDPRLKGVGISEVEMAADLKRANVFFVCPQGREGMAEQGLTQAAGFLKRELASRLRLKFMPELIYRHDDSLDKGAAMEQLLASLDQETGAGENKS